MLVLFDCITISVRKDKRNIQEKAPMRIEIPFNNWSKKKLKINRKFCTSRSKIYGKVGDYFEEDGVVYTIKFVTEFPLWFVKEFLWYVEGADSKEEFIKVWKSIHGGVFKESKLVFTHFFLPELPSDSTFSSQSSHSF